MDKNLGMDQREKGVNVEIDEERWVYDASFDHKGRIPFRASTGVWKASLFIIGKYLYSTSYHKFSSLFFFFSCSESHVGSMFLDSQFFSFLNYFLKMIF